MNRSWPTFVHDVMPGGGWLAWLRRHWGRGRRALLRTLRPRYVAAVGACFTGHCPGCQHDVVDGSDLLWVQNVCGRRLPASRMPSPFRDRFGLVRLGRPEQFTALLLGLVLLLLAIGWQPWSAPLALLPPAFTLWFFRDPERASPRDDSLVLAPADGVVDDLRDEAECAFFAGPALRIGIYLSVFDVHVQRAPIAGVVARCDYRPGRHVPTVRRGVTDANEQLLTWFRGSNGAEVVVRQVAGPFARRIGSVLGSGDVVRQGQRFGLIKFGSRCELWLPHEPGLQLVVAVGQHVVAGVSPLARWSAAGPAAPRDDC